MQFPVIDWKPIIDFVTVNAKIVLDTDLGELVYEDPDDDNFIACALAGKSNPIVSGDKHLLGDAGMPSP